MTKSNESLFTKQIGIQPNRYRLFGISSPKSEALPRFTRDPNSKNPRNLMKARHITYVACSLESTMSETRVAHLRSLKDGEPAEPAAGVRPHPGAVLPAPVAEATEKTFGWLAALRGQRVFHPRGVTFAGGARLTDDAIGLLADRRDPDVLVDATDAAGWTTGAIYDVQPPQKASRDGVVKPTGQWNSYEIVVTGDRIKVLLNGTLINDFNNADDARMTSPSLVGLQNHGPDDQVFFRNVAVRDLPAAPT